nr:MULTISPECIES: hypothetical protein [unclassified Methylobacterium]
MLSVSRAVVSKHREISALPATYAMFLSGVLVLAWAALIASLVLILLEPPAACSGTPGMFFFFSNRLGCLGSILISLLLTVILIGIFRGG